MVRKEEDENRKEEDEDNYDVNFVLFALSDENRHRIIECLKIKGKTDKEITNDKIQDYLKNNYKINLALQTINEHCEILKKARLIGKQKVNNDFSRRRNAYFLDETQIKRIDRIEELLKKPLKDIEKELKSIIRFLKEYEILMISKEFMETVPDDGWMDICFFKESPRYIIEWSLYNEGYKKMRKRGIKIRIITELAIDNIEFCLKMLKDNLVDEIRFLKNIKCGFAVSKNQYMAAFLPDNPQSNASNIMTNAIHSDEKNIIKYGQALFNTCWENALPFLNKYKK